VFIIIVVAVVLLRSGEIDWRVGRESEELWKAGRLFLRLRRRKWACPTNGVDRGGTFCVVVIDGNIL
jgi:hypothetical protein